MPYFACAVVDLTECEQIKDHASVCYRCDLEGLTSSHEFDDLQRRQTRHTGTLWEMSAKRNEKGVR